MSESHVVASPAEAAGHPPTAPASQTSAAAQRPTSLAVAGGLVVVALTLLLFWPVVGFDFLEWDDNWVVFANPLLRGLSWQGIVDILANLNRSGSGYTPLAGLRFAAIDEFWGKDPRAYHIANLVVYLANAVLVYAAIVALVRRMNQEVERSAAQYQREILGATLATLLWSLHPLRVETVAWVAAGPHNQALLFLLLAYLAFGRSKRESNRRWTVLAAVAYAASLLSHPLGLGFAGVLVVADWSSRREGKALSLDVLRDKVPFLAVAGAVLVGNLLVQSGAQGQGADPRFGAANYVTQAFYGLVYYAWKPFAPAGLSPVYTKLLSFDPWAWPFLGSVLVAVATYGCLLVLRRRWPRALGLALAYLLLLLPVLGLTVHPYFLNDRFSLTSSIVLSVPIAHLVACPAVGRWARRALAGACALAVVALIPLTASQNPIWCSTPALLGNVAASLGDHPARAEILARLAEHYLGAGRRAEAAATYQDALKVDPAYPMAHAGLLGLCLAGEGQPLDARAMDCYRRALPAGVAGPRALRGLAEALSTLGLAQVSGLGRELSGEPAAAEAESWSPSVP